MFSEIKVARLVCGYLQHLDCEETKTSFVEECSPRLKLREFASMVDDPDMHMNWNVEGLSLLDVLNEYASMKTTLDSLMNNEFKPDEVVKSDGPLRKLKILSDHWTAKVVELNSKVVAQSRQASERRSPPLAVDICVDTTVIDTRPRSRLSSPKANTSRLILGLRHSYNAPPTTKSAHLIPVKERKSRHTYSDTQGGGFNTQRSRTISKNMANKRHGFTKIVDIPNAKEMGEEVQRMLAKPNSSSGNLADRLSCPEPITAPPSNAEDAVFKTPSPKEPLNSKAVAQSSPMKSRKSQLKSKAPTKKRQIDTFNSMPVLVNCDDNRANLIEQNDDEVISKTLGEPIANAVNAINQGNFDAFVTSAEFENLLDLVDRVTTSNTTDCPNPKEVVITAPPSNSSSTSCLAIDDDTIEETACQENIVDDFQPEPEPEIKLTTADNPDQQFGEASDAFSPENIVPDSTTSFLKTPKHSNVSDTGGSSTQDLTVATNNAAPPEVIQSEEETTNTSTIESDKISVFNDELYGKDNEGISRVVDEINEKGVIDKSPPKPDGSSLSEKLSPRLKINGVVIESNEAITQFVAEMTPNHREKQISPPETREKSPTCKNKSPLQTNDLELQTSVQANCNNLSPNGVINLSDKGFVANLQADHGKIDTIGYIDINTVPNITQTNNVVVSVGVKQVEASTISAASELLQTTTEKSSKNISDIESDHETTEDQNRARKNSKSQPIIKGKNKEECKFCGKKFVNINKHLLTHSPRTRNPYACTLCNSVFPNKEKHDCHFENHHKTIGHGNAIKVQLESTTIPEDSSDELMTLKHEQVKTPAKLIQPASEEHDTDIDNEKEPTLSQEKKVIPPKIAANYEATDDAMSARGNDTRLAEQQKSALRDVAQEGSDETEAALDDSDEGTTQLEKRTPSERSSSQRPVEQLRDPDNTEKILESPKKSRLSAIENLEPAINSLRRSSRTRKIPTRKELPEFHIKPAAAAKKINQNKKKNNNPFLKLVPSIGAFVKSDTRNLQLVTPISEAEENSVSCYLKNICHSGIVTSNEIDHAVSSGVDLDQVSLGQLCMNFDEEKEQEAADANDEANDNLKELLKEDSVEKAIIAATTTVSATPPKARESPCDDRSSKNSPTPKNQFTSSSSTNSSIFNSLFFKTPQKKTVNQSSKESRVSDEFSDSFKTPVKTPKKTLQRTEEIENQALAVDLFQTPRKDDSATVDHSEYWLKKTPLSKMKKKSPMPSPFLLSPVLMSPGTPAKDVSIASISFNQSESFLVTPSVVFQENSSKENSLCLEISPLGSLHTPSPHSNNKDEPLVTPPFDQVTTPNDKFCNANGSFGAARTPRGATKNMTIDNQVMNTPLKALHEAAKRLFCDETGLDKTLVFLSPSKRFLSPSKRIPKRVQLLAADTSSPLRSGHFSNWEARHDVNNLDHYQTKVKESEATPPPSTANTTRKRKASAQCSSNKVAGKKAKRKSKNHEQPDPILPESAIDTNMDLVLQLKTTPRKSATLVKPTCQDTLDNIPNALGLVPKAAVPETNETFKTPSKPLDNIDRKKTPRKAVQRNLLDDVGFKSPLKPPPELSPARGSLTPIKLTPSPGKSSYQIASAKKTSLSPEVDITAAASVIPSPPTPQKTPIKLKKTSLLPKVDLIAAASGISSPRTPQKTPIKLAPSPGKSSYKIASTKKTSLSPKVDLTVTASSKSSTRTPQKTPIKLTTSPGKSSYQIASTKKTSLSTKIDLNAGELKTWEHGTRTPQKKGPTLAKVAPVASQTNRVHKKKVEKVESSLKSPKIIVKISPKKTKDTSDKSEVKGSFGIIKITDPVQDAKEMGEEVQRMLARPNSSSVNFAKRLSTAIASPAKAQEAVLRILPTEAKAMSKNKREVKDNDKTDGGTHQITSSQAKPASPKKMFKTPSKITKTPSKITRKTPSKIITTTPSKITRKATMAPAKLRNAFATTFENPVPPSPAKNDPKTSLLTLSQAHIFFEQEPWDQPDQDELIGSPL